LGKVIRYSHNSQDVIDEILLKTKE